MNVEKCFIGIDVSKRTLDIHLRPLGAIFKLSNSIEGLELLRGKLPEPEQIERVVMESTGGYERECALYLSREIYQEKGIPLLSIMLAKVVILRKPRIN